jgi:hypothetical protein
MIELLIFRKDLSSERRATVSANAVIATDVCNSITCGLRWRHPNALAGPLTSFIFGREIARRAAASALSPVWTK